MEQATERAGTAATRLPASAFELTFSQKVTREELIASLDRMLGLIGCTGCGLNGHEFHFHSERVNPALDKIRTKLLDGKKALVDVEVFEQSRRQF
ncbi:MAG: hypothetical protein EOO14_24910 [Chitinophagaceae bacterium]|nr:MAG: hypothetical protein EOO14_24910 [Chitinophagaceae bacterium]